MESARSLSPAAPAITADDAADVSGRVIDLALRVRAAHTAAREFLRRYAIEAACASVEPFTDRIRRLSVANPNTTRGLH